MLLMNGKVVADKLKSQIKMDVKQLYDKGIKIHLVVIQVGNDKASNIYIRNKEKACKECGIITETWKFDENVDKQTIVNTIKRLNMSSFVTGILVQLPLPKHFSQNDVNEILSYINPIKDVDGFNNKNIGAVVKGDYQLSPCTPSGIVDLLDYYNINISGKKCVVVGRSNIVGKPIALMLLNRDATITICHSKTQNLQSICKEADILICAIGKPKFFTKEYVKQGAVVVDVGIHHTDNGICGDVDYDDVCQLVSAISPVPKGVGAMTVTSLMQNCVTAAKLQIERSE